MPYIDQKHRNSAPPTTPGELNYHITMMLEDYRARHGTSYSTLNSIIGVLECVKQEYYRRVVVPYEDLKMAENGDVYL